MESAMFDLTSVTDVLVPLYSVVVLLFIVAYQKSPETKVEDRYFLKRVVKTAEKKNWRDVMTGFFHQCESDGFDEWLKFIGRPFPIRVLAPKMFHKIHMDMKLTETEFSFHRFWGSEREKPDPIVTLTLGTCSEDAPTYKYTVEKAEDCGTWTCWVVEGEEKVYCKFLPQDPEYNPAIDLTREIIDEETILVSWHGVFKGKVCDMTTTYRRVG